MRVLFIVGTFPSLSETFILNQITGLIELGVDVEIIAQSRPYERKQHDDIAEYRLMERVRYADMQKNKAKRIIKGIHLALANIHKNPAAILKALNFPRYGEQALSLRLLYTIAQMQNRSYDIIHCHFGQNGITGACLKDMEVEAKLVTTFHGNDLSAYILKNPKAYTRLFTNGDLFLPISEQTKQKLQMLGCDPKKTAVHRMGVRMERFEYTPRERIKGEPTTILTIGRLVEKKGHEYAIRAFAKVAATRKDIRYLIVGDGPQRSLLETLAAELGVKDRVEFLGEINQDEAAELYRKSHIFLLPSVTAADGDQEGVPVVLMEAQATGLPVISTKHAGIPEVVEDGKTGYLVGEKDTDALAEKLGYLIEHPEQWPKMGEAGRKLVEEKYDSNKLNKELAGIYIRLLKE